MMVPVKAIVWPDSDMQSAGGLAIEPITRSVMPSPPIAGLGALEDFVYIGGRAPDE